MTLEIIAPPPSSSYLPPSLGEQNYEEERFVVRATNRDNLHDAEQIVKLFHAHYGTQHVAPHVFNPEYWYEREENETGDQLVNMVVSSNQQFVAHLALYHHKRQNTVELVYPAIHPDFRQNIFQICRLLWKNLEEQGRRQQWRLVHHLSVLSQPFFQVVAAKCFCSKAMAILPSCLTRPKGEAGDNQTLVCQSGLLVMYNTLGQKDRMATALYPPEKHAQILKELYAPFPFRRIFRKEQERTKILAARPLDRTTLSNGVSVVSHSHYSIFQSFIVPSEVKDQDAVLSSLDDLYSISRIEGKRVCVGVALDDPLCPNFSAALEAQGYRFSGVMPAIDQHDYLVYCQFCDDELRKFSLYTERAKMLRDYTKSM